MLANSSTSRSDQSEEGIDGIYVFPPSWHGLKQQVIYVAQFGGGIQVVEGIAGAGKSTFALWLSDDQDVLPMSMMSMLPSTEPQNLFFELLLQLGLRPSPSSGTGKLLAMLRGYVQSLHREGSRVVMLIDDAHWIADSDLAALISTMQDASEAGLGLHLILMAEPGLARRIDDLQLLDLAVHDGVLPPLSFSEVSALINRRAAHFSRSEYSPERVQKIWTQTKGIPGKVLALLNSREEIIQAEAVAPRKVKPKVVASSFRGWPVAHFVVLIFLCGVLAWAYLVQKGDPAPQVRAMNVAIPVAGGTETTSAAVNEPGATQPLGDVNSGRPVDMNVKPAVAEIQPGVHTSVALPKSTTQQTVEPTDLNAAAVSAEDGMVEPEETSEKPVSQNVEIAKVIKETGSLDVRDKNIKVPVQPKEPAQPKAPAQMREIGSVKDEVPVIKAVKQAQINTPVVATGRDLISASEARLMSLPSSAYILQLMASSETDKLMAFLDAQPNRKNLMVYRTFRDGKVFHILVEGFYPDKAAASAASMNLPVSQKKAGPWPKRIEFVQKEIGEYRKR